MPRSSERDHDRTHVSRHDSSAEFRRTGKFSPVLKGFRLRSLFDEYLNASLTVAGIISGFI